jgi:small subunit ribosomal protein S21
MANNCLLTRLPSRAQAGFFVNPQRFYKQKEVRLLPSVELRPNESQEQLLRRFRKKVAKSGVLSTVRRKRWFVSKSELRRIQKKKAIRRHRRHQTKTRGK